jgi:hypothetical protein
MIGRRLRVHFNLHTHRFSVIDPAHGRVIASVDTIMLRDVEFRIQAAGLRQLRERKQRRVCAYAIGIVAAVNTDMDTHSMRRITFNPWRSDTFHYSDTAQMVQRAPLVYFAGSYCWSIHHDNSGLRD